MVHDRQKGKLREVIRQLRPFRSPLHILITIAVSIFLVEALVMVLLIYLPHESPFVHALVDSALLLVILSPFLYFFLFRPLLTLVHERERTEENLRKERDRAQKYLDISGVLMVVLDSNARVSLINRKGCEILGWREDEILGKDWIESFIPERNRNEMRRVFKNILQDVYEEAGYFENPVLTKSGEEKVILFHNTVLREDGAVVGTLSSGEDITERKLTEKALVESEARYRLIHDTVFDAIIIADSEDRIIDCNPSAEKIFGYAKSELLSMNVATLMPEDYRERHVQGLKRFIETGESRLMGKIAEYEGLRKSGEVFPVELTLNTFKLGGRLHITGMIRDITERKRAERENARIQARLNQAQKMEAIGRFAGGIAHDFNNILTAIRGNAELAMEEVDKSHPAYERLDGIILSVLLASKFTRQLLLFSRGQPFKLVPVNINQTIENLLIMITRLIGEDVMVKTELDPKLKPTLADEGNIEQVIMNLAVNAKDAMPGGGTLTIKTENVFISEAEARSVPEARAGNSISITVSDTGVGMEKEVVQRIFEPFFTTKELGKGTGFGLAVVYGIIRQHGGWITVRSKPGQGTTFRIYLPAFEEKTPVEAREAEARRPEDGHGESVLIVEDEAQVREFARVALTEHGYKVFEAANAREAADIFNEEAGNFHVVFADLILPDKSGLQLAEELIARKPGLQVLLTSGAIEAKPEWNAIQGKGLKHLQKPYSLTALLRAVSASIEKGRLKR